MPNRRGSLLILSFLFISFLTTWATIMFRQGATELYASERFVDSRQSFNLAEAGLDDAIRYLRALGQQGQTPPVGVLAFDPFGGAQTFSPGTYTVTIDPDDANPTTYIDYYTIDASGVTTAPAIQTQLRSIVRVESFAKFSYFSNSEEKIIGGLTIPMWFTSRDRLYGPVHTNGQWNVSGSPQFRGDVSSVDDSINYRNGGPPNDNPGFHGSVTLDAPQITMPFNATALRVAASSSDGQWYTGNTTFVLRSDGTMLVTNAALGWTNVVRSQPANGAIFVNGGEATVSGTLNGQLTIGASENIIIPDHITYRDNPANGSSDDLLGLVSEHNVIVSEEAPDGLRIFASIMALDESFTVENWWVPPPRGELHLYGGMIEDVRGPVGTFNPGNDQLVSGYGKDYKYDERLATMTPPFFPTTGQFEDVLWQDLGNN